MMEKLQSKAIIIGISDSKEKIPAAAGRISTQPGTAMEIFDRSQDEDKNAGLIEKVTKSGHNSTLEHTVYNIAFENVSVFVEQFMIEFRLASFTVKSRRYVDFSNCGFYSPNFGDDRLNQKYSEWASELFELYNQFIINDIPKEDARFLLPYCLNSNFYCTLNARELLLVIKAMLYGRGKDYPELVSLGEQLLSQVSSLTKGIAKSFEESSKAYTDSLHFNFEHSNKPSSSAPVTLISHTEDAEKQIAKSALVLYGQYSQEDIDLITSNPDNVSVIVKQVLSSDRQRPLENAVFTFRINGVSLSTVTHFARHRIQALSVPSFTEINQDNYIVPDTIKASPELLAKYHQAFNKTKALFDELKSLGVSESLLVYCHLSGHCVDIISTMNARELMLFFKLRTCTRAQWEIRNFAMEMLRLCREKAAFFDYYGPGCFVGKCPEGRLSCGRQEEMKNIFTNRRK